MKTDIYVTFALRSASLLLCLLAFHRWTLHLIPPSVWCWCSSTI